MLSRCLATLSLTLASAALAPASAHAEQPPFVFSPVGPGAGNGALGLGGKLHMVVPELYVPIPTFDLHYVRGFTDNLDLRLSVDTLIVANYADLGLRAHFGGPEFSLGVTGGLTAIVVVFGGSDGGGGAAAFAATPGAFIGFGTREVQVSVGADVPMFFASGAVASIGGDANSAAGSGFLATVRPSAAVEFPAGSVNMYIQGSVLIIPDADFVIGPMLALGASF